MSVQVAQALAVSHSKLGDLHYKFGHLEPALACYQAAVQVRRLAASSPVTQDSCEQVGVAADTICQSVTVGQLVETHLSHLD